MFYIQSTYILQYPSIFFLYSSPPIIICCIVIWEIFVISGAAKCVLVCVCIFCFVRQCLKDKSLHILVFKILVFQHILKYVKGSLAPSVITGIWPTYICMLKIIPKTHISYLYSAHVCIYIYIFYVSVISNCILIISNTIFSMSIWVCFIFCGFYSAQQLYYVSVISNQ